MSGMKKLFIPALIVLATLVTLSNCSKGGGGGNGSCSEAAIQVTTTPAVNSTEPAAPGPNFSLAVNITGGFPSAGATIDVKARPDGNNTPFFTSSVNAVSGVNNFSITNTPASTTCIVEITITSKSCNTNKWTGSYRYSRK